MIILLVVFVSFLSLTQPIRHRDTVLYPALASVHEWLAGAGLLNFISCSYGWLLLPMEMKVSKWPQ